MGYGYEKGHALIPCYRPDVIHAVDLAEDIAIAYGYENFRAEIPTKGTVAQEDSFEKFRKKVSYLLVGLNLLELSSYHISSKNSQLKMMNHEIEDYIELENSKSDEYNIMRYSILANLMQVLKENTHNEYPQNIFESGYTFKTGNSETGVVEESKLSVVLCDRDTDYTKARQILDYIIASLGLKCSIKESKHPSFIDGRAGKIICGKSEIGIIGELSPKIITNFEVEMPVSAFEINLTALFSMIEKL